MKKYILLGCIGLTACTNTICPNQYIANMYANGTLNNYDNAETTCPCTDAQRCPDVKTCPGCHVKHFDRVKLTVEEVGPGYDYNNGIQVVDGCVVTIQDSLNLKNISETRYIPATPEYTCEIVYEKEKNYLKAMGFAE